MPAPSGCEHKAGPNPAWWRTKSAGKGQQKKKAGKAKGTSKDQPAVPIVEEIAEMLEDFQDRSFPVGGRPPGMPSLTEQAADRRASEVRKTMLAPTPKVRPGSVTHEVRISKEPVATEQDLAAPWHAGRSLEAQMERPSSSSGSSKDGMSVPVPKGLKRARGDEEAAASKNEPKKGAPSTKGRQQHCFHLSETTTRRAADWVAAVLRAWQVDRELLPRLLSRAHSLVMNAEIALATGAGVVLNTRSIWYSLNNQYDVKRVRLVAMWKQQVASTSAQPRTPKHHVFEAGVDRFQKTITFMRTWLEAFAKPSGQSLDLMRDTSLKLAIKLVCAGFQAPDQLEGLPEESMTQITSMAREITFLKQVVIHVNEQAFAKRSDRARRMAGMQVAEDAGPKSAFQIASTLRPDMLEQITLTVQQGLEDMGIPASHAHIACPPRQAVAMLGDARREGKNVLQVLDDSEQALRLETVRKSLPQVAAGLKCWHMFAVDVLEYDDCATLPPDRSKDVCRWMACFSNAGTACNYLSYVRWVCRHYRKGMDWDDDALRQLVKGLQRRSLRLRITAMKPSLRLPELVIHRLIILAHELRDYLFSMLCTLSYHFLFRVADEGVPLEAGKPEDAVLAALPEGRHSAIWTQSNLVHVRLQTRKHRPAGSYLIRQCVCAELADQRLCPVHSVENMLASMGEGEKLFLPSLTASQVRAKLKRYLSLLAQPEAQSVGLKVFRASRATNLALQGQPLQLILQAGEWKSAAILSYASCESLDRGQLLVNQLEHSDEED